MALSEEDKKLINLLGTLKEERQEHENRWRDGLEYVLPQRTKFIDSYVEDKRFDTTATRNVHKLADGLFGSNCPQAINWFKLRFLQDSLNDDDEAMTWLQKAQQVMYDAINRSNYYDILPLLLRNGCALETASMAVYEDIDKSKIICITLPIDEIYLQVDANNEVYRIFREFKLNPEQAVIAFGEDKLSDKVVSAAKKHAKGEVIIVHVVDKRKNIDPTKFDNKNMPWRSLIIDHSNNTRISESGYIEQPFINWRFEVRGNCPYGYGPTTDALPDIYTANTMVSDLLKASHKAIDPPTFHPEDTDYSLDAGATNYYSDAGRQVYTIKPYLDFPITLEMIQDVRESIKAAYKADYFMPLMQLADKDMTAREVFERKSERITATGSVQGRLTSEVITPFLTKVFQIEYAANRIPPAPENIEVAQIKIDYLSPLAQEQREVANAQGILASLDTVMPLMQLWPQTQAKLRPEVLMDKLFDNTGMPEDAIVNNKEYQEIQKKNAEREQMLYALQLQQVKADIAVKAGQAVKETIGAGGTT